MNCNQARAVLSMGYSRQVVRQAMHNQLTLQGIHNSFKFQIIVSMKSMTLLCARSSAVQRFYVVIICKLLFQCDLYVLFVSVFNIFMDRIFNFVYPLCILLGHKNISQVLYSKKCRLVIKAYLLRNQLTITFY